MLPFANRAEAGRLLASKLKTYQGRPDVVVVALASGGVPVAFEVAQRLQALLDVTFVRKVGVPWQPEAAMAAVAAGGARIVDHVLVGSLNLSKYFVYGLIEKKGEEIAIIEAPFREMFPVVPLRDRRVILIDDGAATGLTMLAAAEAVRRQNPKEVIATVPVASREARRSFEENIGKSVCLATPEPFASVGEWYESFPQVTDREVHALLFRHRPINAEKDCLLHSAAG
jgi:putative phosphoribosyl transferase